MTSRRGTLLRARRARRGSGVVAYSRPPSVDDRPSVGVHVSGCDFSVHRHTARRAGLRPAPTWGWMTMSQGITNFHATRDNGRGMPSLHPDCGDTIPERQELWCPWCPRNPPRARGSVPLRRTGCRPLGTASTRCLSVSVSVRVRPCWSVWWGKGGGGPQGPPPEDVKG